MKAQQQVLRHRKTRMQKIVAWNPARAVAAQEQSDRAATLALDAPPEERIREVLTATRGPMPLPVLIEKANVSRAIVQRDHVMIMLKAITPEVHPQPNSSRHAWAAWDAYILTSDPDALHAEFLAKNVPISRKLSNTNDGLRAFEVTDNNGYVLCFGRPVD